jgi:hypothetical protein
MKIDSVITVDAVAIRNYVRTIQLLSEVITSTSIRMRTDGRRHFQTTLFKYSVNKIVMKEGCFEKEKGRL